MCKWFCTSEGPSTNLQCLHCHTRYCGACLHGEAGKMESLVKCASCGKKPRTLTKESRGKWKAEPTSSGNNVNTAATSGSTGARATDEEAGEKFASGLREEKKSSGTKAQKSTIFDRLTDTSLYTGTHQHRFDASGQGKGLEGRDSVAKGVGHKPTGGISHRSPAASSSAAASLGTSSPKYSSSANSSPRKPAAKPKSHQSIFDKLTDSSLYTGAHKHRFDGAGHGQGKAGRTQDTGGVTLSQITRPGFH